MTKEMLFSIIAIVGLAMLAILIIYIAMLKIDISNLMASRNYYRTEFEKLSHKVFVNNYTCAKETCNLEGVVFMPVTTQRYTELLEKEKELKEIKNSIRGISNES